MRLGEGGRGNRQQSTEIVKLLSSFVGPSRAHWLEHSLVTINIYFPYSTASKSSTHSWDIAASPLSSLFSQLNERNPFLHCLVNSDKDSAFQLTIRVIIWHSALFGLNSTHRRVSIYSKPSIATQRSEDNGKPLETQTPHLTEEKKHNQSNPWRLQPGKLESHTEWFHTTKS